jgi:hypothetical protein
VCRSVVRKNSIRNNNSPETRSSSVPILRQDSVHPKRNSAYGCHSKKASSLRPSIAEVLSDTDGEYISTQGSHRLGDREKFLQVLDSDRTPYFVSQNLPWREVLCI